MKIPEFKNNNERKEWLRNYQDWPVWYVDDNIGVTYYKFDFDNGAHLIVDEYPSVWCGEDHMTGYYHLVGGPLPPRRPDGAPKWEHHSEYRRSADSETSLVEFLKYIGKEEPGNKDS